ncbi:MAG: archease [Calditrichaeota bacterium]|nr:MAG: archease [Calditrichota bacterium]
MGKYRTINHTADLAVELQADTIEDLFKTAARAWRNAVLEKSKVRKQETKKIELHSPMLDELLVETVSELNYLFSVGQWLFSDFKKLDIYEENEEWYLTAMVTGEPFDEERHQVEAEIKAVTFHKMDIRRVNGKFKTTMVFDI